MPRTRTPGSALVYSTEGGRLCPGCGAPMARCRCASPVAAAPARSGGVVRVGRETQGRAGKGVTTVTGLALAPPALAALARELKTRLGTGGTAADGVIELQGEHRDALVAELTRRGYRVKRAGG